MRKLLLLTFFVFNSVLLFSQKDSLVFFDGNVITGEIKIMNKGILSIETGYSDDDFKIELEKIKEIYTASYITITLSDGTRLDGTLQSEENGKILIITDEGEVTIDNINDIVLMRTVDKTFADRFKASIDLGFNITRSNNFRQFSSRSSVGYDARKWTLNAYYNTILSNQDDADSIRRVESGLSYKMLLPRDWYLPASIDFLSNTDQKLKLRTTFKLGAGKYIIHTNSVYWSFNGGVNLNNENYSVDDNDRNSLEGFLGTELNMFDVGDINLLTNLIAYPSFTERDRMRFDFNFDIKYDLPFDFYVSLGITLNYDNQPVDNSHKLDYYLNSGLGWEW